MLNRIRILNKKTKIIIIIIFICLIWFFICDRGIFYEIQNPITTYRGNIQNPEIYESVKILHKDETNESPRYLNFNSIFYKKEAFNIDSDDSIVLRFKDEDENIMYEDIKLLPSETLDLSFLKRNKNYIVEFKGEEDIFMSFK